MQCKIKKRRQNNIVDSEAYYYYYYSNTYTVEMRRTKIMHEPDYWMNTGMLRWIRHCNQVELATNHCHVRVSPSTDS